MDMFASQLSYDGYGPLDQSIGIQVINTRLVRNHAKIAYLAAGNHELIPNYAQIGATASWPPVSCIDQSVAISPFIGPTNCCTITSAVANLQDSNLSSFTPVDPFIALSRENTPMLGSAPVSYLSLEPALLISNVVRGHSSALSNSLQLMDLSSDNSITFDTDPELANHSWVTGINVTRPISALNLAGDRSWVPAHQDPFNNHFGLFSSFGYVDDVGFLQSTALGSSFEEMAFETIDIWGRRKVFRRIVYRLGLLRRSALNFKELVNRCVSYFEHRASKKQLAAPSKKQYASHRKVAINLPLMC